MGRSISDRMSYRNHYMCSGEATSSHYFSKLYEVVCFFSYVFFDILPLFNLKEVLCFFSMYFLKNCLFYYHFRMSKYHFVIICSTFYSAGVKKRVYIRIINGHFLTISRQFLKAMIK